MKKFLSLLMCAIVNLSAFAIRTTMTSSIYANSYGPIQTSQPTITWHNAIKKVEFINLTDSASGMSTALSTATEIFSDAMEQEYIDLVNIRAEVMFGDSSDSFEIGELCKVEIEYSDTIVDNSRYHNISWQYMGQNVPVLIPLAMSNQCRGDFYGTAMRIKLNPTLSYHYDITPPESNEYDLTTILLRALAMGCGIQSTLDPVNVSFGKTINGQTYINAFDTQIYNDSNDTYVGAISDPTAQISFLANHNIFVDGLSNMYSLNNVPIQLYNEWSRGAHGFSVDYRTLNTIDGMGTYTDDDFLENPDFVDLLDYEITAGTSIRTITPYTMALLRKLGWMKTIPVGPDPLANLYNCKLQCNATVLQPNTPYSLSTNYNDVDLIDFVGELFAQDSVRTIGTPVPFVSLFSYSSIPNNVQWERNPISKNILGRIRGVVSQGGNELEKICTIEIPYKPNKPIVRKTETTTDGNIQLDLRAFANGSNTYTVTYTGVTNSDTHSFTVSANAIDTLLTNIPGTQLYNMSIYGTNSQGNSDLTNFTFGFSARPALNMTVWVNGNTVTYDLSNNGAIDISDVVISSVQIADPNGYIWLTPNAGSGDPINISSLSRGYYVLTVVADGNTYSRMFIKRR